MIILTGNDIVRAVRRLAAQAVEKTEDVRDLAVVGIGRRGGVLASRIQEEIARSEGVLLPLGLLEVSHARGDGSLHGAAECTAEDIHFDLTGKDVILCDDVLFTGRGGYAAVKALSACARSVRLYCLVDRGHRELPLFAEGVGKYVPTAKREKIRVKFTETDGEDCVLLEKN